jgi:hypothetical protein
MQVTLDSIDKRVDGRPSWLVCGLIAFLASALGIAVTGLVVSLSAHG